MIGAVKLSRLGGFRHISVGGTARSLNLPVSDGPGLAFDGIKFAV